MADTGGILLRAAAYLAILGGLFGAFVSLSGALTFIPDRIHNTTSLGTAEWLTAVSIFAAVVSVIGLAGGAAMLRGRTWGWGAAMTGAVGSIVAAALFVAVMPASAPSPVPGGAEPPALLALVATGYGGGILLLALGGRERRSRQGNPVPL